MAESRMTAGRDYVYDRVVPDEVQRLGKLLRAFVWGQLAVGIAWAITTTAISPADAPFRLGILAVAAAASAGTLVLERRGHVKAGAALLVGSLWIALIARVVVTASLSHGSWFMLAVLVGEAGLFIGFGAATVVSVVSAGVGLVVAVLVERGVLVSSPAPGLWLDWLAGVLVFAVIGFLQVSAVRLYRGGLEVARAASRRHRALFDGAPVALFELDLDQVGAGVVATTDVNDAALRLLGMPREEVLRIGPPREVQAVLVEAVARGDKMLEHELTLDLGGEPRQLVVRTELIEDLRHVIVSLADVTAQRQLAERVNDARRLQTVAALAGSIAHDFNNLLTVSQMNAERLGRRVAAVAASRELERIRDANARSATLTQQLLVFSRRDVAHRQVFAPDVVITNLEPLLRRTLDPRLELVVDARSNGAAIDMDAAQLELLITNLVYNAADAVPGDGTLRVECQRRSLAHKTDELAAGEYVVVAVSDTGAGMTDETRARAFEPFFTTRPGKRAGLGLAIVKRIAEEAGGGVRIESSPTAGTRVEVLLPVTTAATTAIDASAGNERILLVEDDDGVREVARSTLEEAGYAVVAVRNGDEALATIATRSDIDLVVSDLVMPGIGGVELVDRLRTTHPTLPVLYVSGHAADGPPVREGDRRVAFLAKPFTAGQLLASVRSVLPAGLV